MSIYSRDQDGDFILKPKIDETTASIKAEAKKMAEMCNHDLVLGECEKRCMEDYSKQRERYLVRKYTNLCAGRPFDEKWRYKTEVKEECIDMAATSKAYNLWKNPDIRRRTQECLAEYEEKAQFLLRNATEMLIAEESKKNNHNLKQRLEKTKQKLDNIKIEQEQVQQASITDEELLLCFCLGLSL